jgi:hypothetical protein
MNKQSIIDVVLKEVRVAATDVSRLKLLHQKGLLKLKLRKLNSVDDIARTIINSLGMKHARWEERYISRDGISGGAVDVIGELNDKKVVVTWKQEWDELSIVELKTMKTIA